MRSRAPLLGGHRLPCALQKLALCLAVTTSACRLFYLRRFFPQLCCAACVISIPYQGSNARPLQWEHSVLTPGPLGKSPCAGV